MTQVPKHTPDSEKSAADIEGPWQDPNFESGLIQRCHKNWTTPIRQLSDEKLATFLRQNIAAALVIAEAGRRLDAGITDDSELYDGELAEALKDKLRRDRIGG